jgi:hypothetical protein
MKCIIINRQQSALYSLLVDKKTANTFDIQRIGLRNPSQVIRQLIKLGASITKSQKTAIDDYGYSHNRVAFYTFEGFTDGE